MNNYKEIVEKLDTAKIVQLMEKLGVTDYEQKEGYVIFPTICHNIDESEASHKLYYYENSHMFMCYTNCQAMSPFTFLKQYYETRNIEYDWYNDVYQVILNCSNFNPLFSFSIERYEKKRDNYIREQGKKIKTYSKKVLDVFEKTYPQEWLEDGISKKAMDKFNILYSISQNKIIIPHYNINGELVGIRGRALNPEEIEYGGKYMPVKVEQTWYTHPLSLNLYGLYENKDNIKKNGYCFIAEGEKSVLQAESFSQDNCVVAACGSNFNKFQLRLLLKSCYPKEIIICFDNEELKGQDVYFKKLYKICSKYKEYCNFSFVYDRNGLTKLKDSPFDNGEETFNKLIEKRVIVR